MTHHALLSVTAIAIAAGLLTGCKSEPADPNAAAAEVEEFAERIHGGKPPPAPTTPETPAPGPTAPEPAPAIDPSVTPDGPADSCGASRMGAFLGRKADDVTRARILNATADVLEVRFIDASAAMLQPDPASPRLNILIDPQGIIRDVACG
jgi:hypothetical protein